MNLMSTKLLHNYIAKLFKEKKQNYNLTKYQSNNGFTLIELLVVISIIGILAALATFTYTDSQQKGRDSKRKSDLTAIQKALELMKQDTAGSYYYPICNPSAASCQLTASTSMTPNMTTSYIKAIPTDPKTNSGFWYYTFDSTGAACTTSGSCTKYSLVTCLENSKDPAKDSTQNTAACGVLATTNTPSYTISNL